MSWIDGEIVLVSLAAMFSPTTLSFSVLALVLGDRPLRTGFWFYLGAFGATLAVGIVASFFIGDLAASDTSTPKTWVAVLDLILGALALIYVVVFLRRPRDPARVQSMIEKMGKLATAPVTGHRRRRRCARQPRWIHPDRPEGHLGAESEHDPVRRGLAVLHSGISAPARARTPFPPGCPRLDSAAAGPGPYLSGAGRENDRSGDRRAPGGLAHS